MATVYSNFITSMAAQSPFFDFRPLDAYIEEPALTITLIPSSDKSSAHRYSQLDDDHLLTTEEVADWLKVKPNTLAKARYDGMSSFPDHKKIGGRSIRYRVGDVRTWLKEHHREHGGYLL